MEPLRRPIPKQNTFLWFRHEGGGAGDNIMKSTTRAMMEEGARRMPPPKQRQKSLITFGSKMTDGMFDHIEDATQMITTYDRFYNRTHAQDKIEEEVEVEQKSVEEPSILGDNLPKHYNRLPLNNFMATHIETKFTDDFFWQRSKERQRVDCYRQKRRESTCFPTYDREKYFVDDADDQYNRKNRYKPLPVTEDVEMPSLQYGYNQLIDATVDKFDSLMMGSSKACS